MDDKTRIDDRGWERTARRGSALQSSSPSSQVSGGDPQSQLFFPNEPCYWWRRCKYLRAREVESREGDEDEGDEGGRRGRRGRRGRKNLPNNMLPGFITEDQTHAILQPDSAQEFDSELNAMPAALESSPAARTLTETRLLSSCTHVTRHTNYRTHVRPRRSCNATIGEPGR